MDETTKAQLRVIHRVLEVLSDVDVPAWLFGGWGLDARIGRITRAHGDVEFWVERSDSVRSKAALVEAGSTALSTQPPEEACEFVWDDVTFSTAYFDRRADDMFSQPAGRWSDWVFPPDSFGDVPGRLDGRTVPAMSVAGMLAMKEQYPTLRNGHPWRSKDVGDIAILRELLAEPDFGSCGTRSSRGARRVAISDRTPGSQTQPLPDRALAKASARGADSYIGTSIGSR